MDKTKLAIEVFNANAIGYQDKFMEMDLYHDTFDTFCKNIIKENAVVLDIACGPGNITNYLLKKCPDFKILGIDLSENMIALARANNPTVEFMIMDCREISNIGIKYDAVMCGFCLPYLSKKESVKLIADVSGLLNTDGLFYASTMEDDYSKSGYEGPSYGGPEKVYIHYHQADYLTKAFDVNGLTIIDIQRKDYPEKDGSFTTDLIIIAKKETL